MGEQCSYRSTEDEFVLAAGCCWLLLAAGC